LGNVNKGTIKRNYTKFSFRGNQNLNRGRPPLFTEEEYEKLIAIILEAYVRRNPMTVVEICKFVQRNFHKELIPNTFYIMMSKEPRVKACQGVPMEDKRLAVTQEQIRAYFHTLYETVNGVPAHFLFNMDEMGHQPWADARDKVCFVPTNHSGATVNYPVSRTGRRITLIGCIAADGSFLRPSVIIPRKTYDDDLMLYGLTPEKVDVYHQKKGYIDKDIFFTWMTDTFVPELERRRMQFGYGPACPIMDNCTSHTGEDIDAICQAHRINIIWLPPHSSNQLQMLDLSVFGITKRFIARANRMDPVYIQIEHIAKVVNSFMQAAIPINIVQSFKIAGISLINDDGIIRCAVTPHTAKCEFLDGIAILLDPILNEEEEEEPDMEAYLEQCATLLFDLAQTAEATA
jgi:hypothetical protein